MVCAFQGWNDAGDAASSAVSFLASALEARRFARIDSEEFYDFQANRPCIRFSEATGRRPRTPRGRRTARDRVADGGDLRGAGTARAARPGARAGRRAVDALARVHHAPGRPRGGAGSAGGRLAGRAARRCAPHAPGGDERSCLRCDAARPARHPALQLRGADGHRRRVALRLRTGRAAVGEPVGVRSALRGGGGQPQGGAGAAAPGGSPDRRVRGRIGAGSGGSRLRTPGGAGRAQRPGHPGVRRTPGAGGRQRRAGARPRTCPQATSSPANSSGSCASGAATGNSSYPQSASCLSVS